MFVGYVGFDPITATIDFCFGLGYGYLIFDHAKTKKQ